MVEGWLILGLFFLAVLNGTSALYTAHCKARGVVEAADNPGLPFQRLLERLIEFARTVKVHDADVSIWGTNH